MSKPTLCKVWVRIDFGVMPVKLPWRDEELRLVVVRGFGKRPRMLLTNLAVNEKLQSEGKDGTDHSYQALWQVVEGYLTRWRIEETIRFVKQCYGFEHIRVMSYESWKNMSALVLATAYFTAAWLGRGVRKDVLVAHIEHMHQRFNDVPEFFLYALADGIRRAFSRYGTWETKAVTKPKPTKDSQPDLPGWDEIAFLGADESSMRQPAAGCEAATNVVSRPEEPAVAREHFAARCDFDPRRHGRVLCTRVEIVSEGCREMRVGRAAGPEGGMRPAGTSITLGKIDFTLISQGRSRCPPSKNRETPAGRREKLREKYSENFSQAPCAA